MKKLGIHKPIVFLCITYYKNITFCIAAYILLTDNLSRAKT